MPVPSIPYDFSSRLNQVGERMATTNRTSIMIIRGGDHLFVRNPLPISMDTEYINSFGLTKIASRLQDFVFDASSLFDWAIPRPIEDDKFLWRGRMYQTMLLGDELFTYTTSSRRRIRVHTKQITFKSSNDS